VGGVALGVLRWAPVLAEAPLDVRAAPAAALAVVLAAIAAALPGERQPGPWRAAALLALLSGLALAGVVALRPAAGLALEVVGPPGVLGTLPPGPVDVIGPDLRDLPSYRRTTLRAAGELRVPATGTYRLWADGRGGIEVKIDGHPVLVHEETERLSAGADVPMSSGSHRLELSSLRIGPGPRLRLGWTRPDGSSEMLPARFLGPAIPAWWWRGTDLLASLLAAALAALVWWLPWDRERSLAPAAATRREIALSLLGHAAVLVLMSWPLVFDLAGSGVTDRPDGRLNAWILAWDAHALLHDPMGIFEAPAFHPLPDALAFSESLLLPGALSLPFQALGPVFAYNVVLLLALLFSGLGAQLLARRAGADPLAAWAGGVAFGAGAHRWIRLAHLHAQVTPFLPLALLALDRFLERRTLKRALLLGALVAAQGLTSVYTGALLALALGVALALAAVCSRLRLRDLASLAGGLLLAVVLVAPAVRPYLRMRAFQGVEWSLSDIAIYATTLDSYAASGTRLYGGITQRHLDPERVRDTLFPGVTLLVLGLSGLASAPRRYRAVAIAASALAIVISLGPETALYRFLYEHVVLVRGVRALSRFSLVPVLALSVLMGLALSGRRRLLFVALPLLLLESSNVPIRFAPALVPSEAARSLAGRPGAVAYLPLGERDTEAMLEGVAHWRPLLNGDSGFVPRPYTRAMELLETPGEDGWCFLRAVGVTEVVSRAELPLEPVARFGEERVWRVPAGPAALPVLDSGQPVVDREGVIDLGRVVSVGAVGFELNEAPWVAQPRLEISLDGFNWMAIEASASLVEATLSLYRDPRHGRGELRIGPVRARYLRPDPALPARPGTFSVH
jgi:hypothetical protein